MKDCDRAEYMIAQGEGLVKLGMAALLCMCAVAGADVFLKWC